METDLHRVIYSRQVKTFIKNNKKKKLTNSFINIYNLTIKKKKKLLIIIYF